MDENAAIIYLSDDLTNPVFEIAKYRIGDRLRITQAKDTEKDWPETANVLREAVGKVFPVEDVLLWETENPEHPWYVTYSFECTPEDTIFMGEDEVEEE